MENSKLIRHSFIHSFGTLVYITLVALVMQNGERLFGKTNSFFVPVAMLLLFVLSATIVGLLVLGRPVWLYFNSQKQEALKMFFYTLSWLALFTILVFSFLALRSK